MNGVLGTAAVVLKNAWLEVSAVSATTRAADDPVAQALALDGSRRSSTAARIFVEEGGELGAQAVPFGELGENVGDLSR